MYHPINCLDNEPLSLYFQFLIPWSYRCFIGFFLLDFIKYFTLIVIILLPVVSITLNSPVLFPAFPCMICFSLCYSFHKNKQTKKKIEESTSIHTPYTVLLIHYVSNQRSVVLPFIARLPMNVFNKHLRRAGGWYEFPYTPSTYWEKWLLNLVLLTFTNKRFVYILSWIGKAWGTSSWTGALGTAAWTIRAPPTQWGRICQGSSLAKYIIICLTWEKIHEHTFTKVLYTAE